MRSWEYLAVPSGSATQPSERRWISPPSYVTWRVPGEAVLPEHTLTHMLRTLPEGWQHIRAESEHEPDTGEIDWSETR